MLNYVSKGRAKRRQGATREYVRPNSDFRALERESFSGAWVRIGVRELPRRVRMAENTREVAQIGKSVVIKGELSGSEDLYLDGEVEGSIELKQNAVTIGPNGKAKAKITAKSVVVDGKVNGNVIGSDRVELR